MNRINRKRLIFRNTFFAFVMMLSPTIALSQDVNKNLTDFGISLGISNYQVKDRVLNNLKHSGTLLSFGLSYTRTAGISLRGIRLNFIFSTLRSRYESENNSYSLSTELSYRYLRRAKQLTGNTDLFLGGMAGINQHINFFEMWDESHIYWLTAYSLGPAGLLTYRKSNKSAFSIDISLPLLSFISRPPERFLYKELDPSLFWILGRIHDNMRLTSIHRHFAVDVTLGYTHGEPGGSKRLLFWHLSYLRNSISYSKDLSIATHTFGIAFLF